MRRAFDNPFAVHRVLRERYRLADADWSRLLARIDAFGNRGAIVGPHGSGKTTLLEDLGTRLSALGWQVRQMRFDRESHELPHGLRFRSGDFVLCDGAEQLGLLDWLRLRRTASGAGGLVITTHRAGRLPTVHRCDTSPVLLRELVASMGSNLTPREAEALHARHAGNIRDAIREMYDRWSQGDGSLAASIEEVGEQCPAVIG